jgi:hypothetical protein
MLIGPLEPKGQGWVCSIVGAIETKCRLSVHQQGDFAVASHIRQ